jgi:hypothetical protein
MKERTIAAQAAALLAGLGETPEEIAAMLLGAGYRGEQVNPFACPCGSCLRDHLGTSVSVRDDFLMAEGEQASLAPQVAAFVEAFDAGKYPQLVARP